MTSQEKTKVVLRARYQEVLKTPASMAFFEAIHKFIAYIETHPELSGRLSGRTKVNKELNIPKKYGYLKQIYQGLEDIAKRPKNDLGHDRYMVIRELSRIQNKETSDTNSFWKKRELFRNIAAEIYKILSEEPAGEKK